MRHIPRYNHFGIHAHTGEEHLYLLGGGVLRFIQNHYGIVQRASAHESEGSNLNDVQLHVLFQFGGGNHVLQGVVKRLQVRVYLVLHVAGQETEFLSGLYGGTAEDYFLYLLVLQRAYGKGDGRIGLARPGRAYGKYHVVPAKCLYQFQLVFAARNNGLSRYAEHDDIARLFSLWGVSFDDIDDDFLFQRIIFGTIFFEFGDVFFKRAHLLFISQHFDDIAAGNDAEFGIQSFYQLHIGVVYAVKDNRVDILKNNQFFYHRYVLKFNSFFR